jgi:hypothetical protein
MQGLFYWKFCWKFSNFPDGTTQRLFFVIFPMARLTVELRHWIFVPMF